MTASFKRLIKPLLIALPVLALATSPVLAAKHKSKHHVTHHKVMTIGKTHKKTHTRSPG